ncbi:hypothetical protein Pyrfu_0099 [Pyrolobus fumarii 1A]|uniref:DNA-directed RNA polymerase subunit Rpo8 n=1 Tax=Pyrolobus fumarii (strain DSM 11204 / 1A) TaxID=694429 RepID=G0EED0_PYRF1|nr:DNA-directed RNA polymerase subunit G [Pyrolobus fumarii]AEM37971.1 hypothetical protein Pyrfu_0099 [Pyrolobus fumarii 1A]
MSFTEVLSFRGVVRSVEQERIPEILLATLTSEDGSIEVQMDWHKEVFTLPEGSKVLFRLTRGIPDYKEGVDFVGRATVVTVREHEGQWEHILSIGGLLVVVRTNKKLDIMPTEKLYVHIAPLEE